MIEEDRYCVDISNQLLATQALLKRVNQEILRAHIRGCVRDGLHTDEPNPKLEEAFSYWKAGHITEESGPAKFAWPVYII